MSLSRLSRPTPPHYRTQKQTELARAREMLAREFDKRRELTPLERMARDVFPLIDAITHDVLRQRKRD